MKKLGSILFTIFAASNCCLGGGFQLTTQGIRQMGLGGSGTALTWNADIVYYNPSGMADLNLWEISANGSANFSALTYTKNNYSTGSIEQVLPAVNLYAAGPIRTKKTADKISVGLGIYSPFGYKTVWNDNWAGRYIVQDASFQTLFAQPTVCYKFSPKFSFGAGYVVAFGDMSWRQALVVPDANGNDGSRSLNAMLWGRGFNAGLHFKVTKTLQVGLSYRSQVNMFADRGNTSATVSPAFDNSFPATKFSTRMSLPQVASFGVGYRPVQKLVLQADVNYTGWDCYDSLKFDIAQNTILQEDARNPRMYKNTFTYRLGINYAFSEKFAVMAGGAWDESPVQDNYVSPEFPDADNILTSLGLSFRPIEKLTITAAAQYYISQPRSSNYAYGNFSGSYEVNRMTGGLGVAFDF